MSEERVRVTADDDGIRLDRWFRRHHPEVTQATLQQWLRSGRVRVNGEKSEANARLEKGQELHLKLPDDRPTKRAPRPRRPLSAEDEALIRGMVIHRDDHAIVLNKPPGLATQGGSGTTAHVDRLLDGLVESDEAPRPRLVHRLDKDTSGVLLVAGSPGSAAHFSRAFAGRTTRKTYLAIVVGVPSVEVGEIDLPLAKQPGSGGEKMHVDKEHGQSAVTRYRVIDRAGNQAAFVALQPITGRTHQLRAHMAAIGHPIVGDGKYGGKAAFLTGTISRKLHLHARRLRIDHPAGGKLEITADLPDHFAGSVADLGFELADADATPVTPRSTARPDAAKARARAHAKTVRKERRGERRSRGGGGGGGGGPRRPKRPR